MWFMILVKATKRSEAGAMPTEEMLAEQLMYHEELSRAGVLRDARGLKPSSHAWRITNSGTDRTTTEGPFDDENLIAGYTLIEVSSPEEAMEWTMRYPKTALEGEVGEIEVRELFELSDFAEGPSIHGFRELGRIDKIAEDVERTRPDLTRAVAPNGTVTVLFTDIEASTELTERLGDRRWVDLLRAHNAIVRDQLARHSGFEVKSQGDGFMLAFPSARDALQCAIGIQGALAEDPNGEKLRVRIGLHTGEPIRDADDFYGRAVNLAARIASEARGREILVSSLVRELIESSGEFSFTAPMDVELKGLSGTHRLSGVDWQA
jgi:class 3 adenylate cyclase